MSWNNGYERRKFEAEQKKLAEEYRALGMSEEKIQAMYEFDLAQFNSKRRYYTHTQEFSTSDFEEGESDDSESTLLHKFFDELTVTIEYGSYSSRYWWIEEIEDEELAGRVRKLTAEEIEMLTLVAFEGYSQVDAAEKMGIPYRTFKYKMQKIKVFLKNF